jgi:hypothetical protein
VAAAGRRLGLRAWGGGNATDIPLSPYGSPIPGLEPGRNASISDVRTDADGGRARRRTSATSEATVGWLSPLSWEF